MVKIAEFVNVGTETKLKNNEKLDELKAFLKQLDEENDKMMEELK